jgi:site-specific recombinase XerD
MVRRADLQSIAPTLCMLVISDLRSSISFISAISRILRAIQAGNVTILLAKSGRQDSRLVMARRPAFKVTKTPDGWRVNVPASVAESGKRERHFHKTRDAAIAHASRLREQFQKHGEAAAIIRPSLAEAAVNAEKVLQPWGVSLVEAATIVAEMRRREQASKRLDKAADAWLIACGGLRERTVGGYRQIANRLKEALGERLLATIAADELQKVLAPPGSSGAAVLGRIRNAKAFWRWAAKKGWCDVGVFSAVEAPKTIRDSDGIAILTPTESRLLLEVAETHYPDAVASYALHLFAGIRVEELRRIEARHVTPEGITLPAEVTKKGRRRHINPSPSLTAWLDVYPFKPCPNWREVDKACRRLAGWDLESRLLQRNADYQELPKPSRGKWPQNALRHSHASYAIAAGVPLESLLFEFGHTGGPAVLREHYVGRASKKDAIEFFSIGPKGSQIPAISAA